jgi:enoyl-[acyl-carrier protein] reductase II
MLRTRLCDMFGISAPIVLAPFGPWDEVDLAAAVCESGALGSVGTAIRSPGELREQWARLRSLTDRPFAVNHTGRPFNEEAFAATLEARPAAISFHMGIPADLIARAHDRGILWL